jgi:hypothetical protein
MPITKSCQAVAAKCRDLRLPAGLVEIPVQTHATYCKYLLWLGIIVT